MVNDSILQSTFQQIVANGFQKLILTSTTPEDAYDEVVSKYNEALAKIKQPHVRIELETCRTVRRACALVSLGELQTQL